MVQNLSVELITENDLVLKGSVQRLLFGVSGIPDASFAHKVELTIMHGHRFRRTYKSSPEATRPC
jgi:hypothetical protein